MSKSKVFLYLLLSFLTGVLVASVLVLPYKDVYLLKFVSGFLTILSIIYLVLFWKKERFIFGFLILLFTFGIYWYQSDIEKSLFNQEKREEIVKQKETSGMVVDEPEFKNDRANYILFSEDCYCKILIQSVRYPEYRYGDELIVVGDIKEPENFADDFDWKAYLAKNDVYLTVYNPKINLIGHDNGSAVYRYLYNFKNGIEDIFKENLSEPHASLLAGITLGSRSGIPKDISEKFKETGVAHIVALSGYNISIIASVIMGLFIFFRAPRSISFWLSVVVIAFFVLMTGASASVARAAVMGILVLIARQQGRMYIATNALVFAGAVMVFLNPKILRFDVGFQLSFLATLGLIFLYPKLENKLKNTPRLLGIKEAFIATMSAQIFVLPLLIYQFKYFSMIGILVNVLILPAVPIAMFFGFAGAFTGLISPIFSKIFLWPAWLFLSWILEIVEMF